MSNNETDCVARRSCKNQVELKTEKTERVHQNLDQNRKTVRESADVAVDASRNSQGLKLFLVKSQRNNLTKIGCFKNYGSF